MSLPYSNFLRQPRRPMCGCVETSYYRPGADKLFGIVFTFLGLSVLLAGLHPVLSVQAQSSSTASLSLPAYQAELATALDQIQNAPTPETVRAVQTHLASIKAVTGNGGKSVSIEPLLGEPATSTPTAADAEARLSLVLTQIGDGQELESAAKLALLTTIFEGAQFAQRESLWQRFWRWLRQWLPDLSNGAEAAPNSFARYATYLIGYLIIGVSAILLLYLLSIWLQNLLGGFLGGTGHGRRLTPDGEFLNAVEAKEQAHQLARSGSFREAVRRLYLSALLTLDERSLLHYDRSNTNREVLATVRNNPALYQRLQPIVEIFDDVWYGIHEPDQSTFDHYRAAVEQLEQDTA